MPDLQRCMRISNVFGPSGYEHDAAALMMREAAAFSPKKDAMQNVYAGLPGNTGARRTVLLDAHMDEVGFMVQSVTANGLLKLVPLGGWVEHNVPAQVFAIKTADGRFVHAVSTSKPPHFMTAAERNAPLSMDSILLDAGVCSRADAEALGLEPGLPAAPLVTCEYDERTGMLLGKAFDCRLGCAGVLEVLEHLSGKALSVDVTAAFSTQEEVGLRGAKVTAQRVQPALAICLEGTPADDTFTPAGEAQGALRGGVQIRHRDGSMIAHPGLVAFARKVAQECGIRHQCAVRTGGGTNGGAIHLAGTGVPTLVLGIPVRYAHTHYGYSAASDVDDAVALAAAIVERLTPDVLDELCPVL